MPLPQGEWSAVIDGDEVALEIGPTDPDGVVSGSLQYVGMAGLVFLGLWDEVAQRFAFAISLAGPAALVDGAVGIDVGDLSKGTTRQFVGYLMQTPRNPAPGRDVVWALAGSFESGPLAGGNRRRSCFGWYATLEEVR